MLRFWKWLFSRKKSASRNLDLAGFAPAAEKLMGPPFSAKPTRETLRSLNWRNETVADESDIVFTSQPLEQLVPTGPIAANPLRATLASLNWGNRRVHASATENRPMRKPTRAALSPQLVTSVDDVMNHIAWD